MTLKEIYLEKRDIRESEIPEEWKASFNRFIFGSTCTADTNEDGYVKEFIYYGYDFRIWYRQNQEAIERDEKIETLLRSNNT